MTSFITTISITRIGDDGKPTPFTTVINDSVSINPSTTVIPKTTAVTSVLPSSAPSSVVPLSVTNTSNNSPSPTANIGTDTNSTISGSGVPNPTSSTAPVAGTSTGLSSGAAAGLAIGCIIAGLAIGVLAAFLFLRRRKRTASPEYVPMQATTKPFDDKRLPHSPAAVAAPDVLQLNQFLLQSKPDNDLINELRALGHLIQQHVENNYHLRPVSHEDVQANLPVLTQILVELGFPHQAAASAALLPLEPRSRYAALQYIISRAILGGVAVTSTSRLSMLPGSVAGFGSQIPPVEPHRGNQQALSLAFTRWRQLSAFLMNPHRSERAALTPEAGATQRAHSLVQALNNILGYFVDRDRPRQEKNLQGVILECTKFGYVLFSQPAEFRLNFESGQSANTVVVCPGLEKISDDQGNRYHIAQVLMPPTLEAIR